jgi:hypothetical protein
LEGAVNFLYISRTLRIGRREKNKIEKERRVCEGDEDMKNKKKQDEEEKKVKKKKNIKTRHFNKNKRASENHSQVNITRSRRKALINNT